MAKASDYLVAMFFDLSCRGAVVIEKKKLLGLLGKSHDRPTAWEQLLDLWEESGHNRDELNGAEHDRHIVLTYGLELQTIRTWAGEG